MLPSYSTWSEKVKGIDHEIEKSHAKTCSPVCLLVQSLYLVIVGSYEVFLIEDKVCKYCVFSTGSTQLYIKALRFAEIEVFASKCKHHYTVVIKVFPTTPHFERLIPFSLK